MSNKTTRILSIILMALPALMLAMSGFMKLSGAPQIVEGLGKAGLGSYIVLFGLIELVSVVLLWIPKTRRLAFLLICCYLGGALSIELAAHQPPMAALILAVLWTGIYLRDRSVFLEAKPAQ
jgi:hypothetical protein